MASKSSSQPIRDDDIPQEREKSNSPSHSQPPQRPPRYKSVPNRLRRGIDRSISGVSESIPEESPSPPNPKKKGVSFKQPIPSPPRKKRSAPAQVQGKGKKKVAESSSKSKPARKKRATTSSFTSSKDQASSQATSSSHTHSGDEPSVMPNAIQEIYRNPDPPRGFTVTNTFLSEAQSTLFQESYLKKEFCAIVAVDLAQLRQDCNVNLSPWLAQYDSFTSIAAPYSPNLVRMFYFNMQTANILDSDNVLVEERITTSVRGVTFTLSASILNTILQLPNTIPVSTPKYSNQEIFTTLKPNEEFPENQRHSLSFKPGSMSPVNRVLWYIYSRNFIQKGGSFTHFSSRDYRFFTAFVRKHPLNIGHWVFQEMLRFKFSSRRTSHIPFPSLISVILFYHKIWYVGPPEVMKYPPMFGKAQLNFMKLTFEAEGSGQSRAPSHSRAPSGSHARASHSRAQEAQSAPSQPPLPSNLGTQIKEVVDAAIARLSIRLEFEIGKLVSEVKEGNHAMVDAQDEMKAQISGLLKENQALQTQVAILTEQNSVLSDQLVDLDARSSTQIVSSTIILEKVDKILKHLGLSPSSIPIPKAEPDPSSSSPSFTFTSPQVPTSLPNPSTPIFSSPLTVPTPSTEILSPSSPPTPTTEILHLTPSTVILPQSPPPTPLIDPLPESTISASFEDDKGGEKGKAQLEE